MKGSAAVSRVKVSADGQGVVSHTGVGMLREVADLSGLSAQVTAALADTYRGPWIHAPGDVFADLAAAVADGADCVDGVGQLLGDREQVFGPVASTTTLWRCVDERIDAAHLPAIRAAINAAVRDAAEVLTDGGDWYPAIESDGGIRDGAWIGEATALVDLSTWPAGTRLILRKERPHPGAQLRFTDSDGHRITGFLTDTADGVIAGQLAGLELRHRQHARVEDRIRQAKATGLRNLPFNAFDANAAWLEIVMAATDLIAWTKLIGFTDNPDLACCEIATFRYRVLHVAARIIRGARQLCLRIDATWRWAQAIATAWTRIRAAFT